MRFEIFLYKYFLKSKFYLYKIWYLKIIRYYFFFFWFFFKKLYFTTSLRLFCKLPPYGKRTRTNRRIFRTLYKYLSIFQKKYFKLFNLKKQKISKYYKNVWI